MIKQGATTSYKLEIAQGVHVWGTDTFNIALYTSVADLNETTTVYTTTGEVVTTGYVAGGNALVVSVNPTTSNKVAYMSFADTVWNAAITARCALIYNASKGNKAVAVLDFGADKTSRLTFTVQFPAAAYDTAILRIQ
jgi:hypothetical protein